MRVNREGVVGTAFPQLWGRVDDVPNPSARTEKLLLLYFRFVFIGENAKGLKISGLKPTRKLDLGVPYVSFYHERHWQMSVEPPPA